MLELFLALSVSVVSTYHIGNSLTNDGLGNNSGNVQNGTYGLEAMASQYGFEDYTLAMHIDSSQGLTSIWDNPEGVKQGGIDVLREPWGGYTKALTEYHWDNIILQPWLKATETLGTDKAAISNFIELAHQNPDNADSVFYIYQFWPQQSFGNLSEYWLGESANDDDTVVRPKRQYYDNLMAWARDTWTANGTIVREIPVGEVWHRVNLAIELGEITGITTSDLYRDDLHASGSLGRYLAAATQFAVLFKTDVRGMVPPYPQFGTTFPQSLYDEFNKIIWQVVSSDPNTGVADFNNDGWVDHQDLAAWQLGYGTEFTGRDFLAWQRSYNPSPAPSMDVVPEPEAAVLSVVLAAAALMAGRVSSKMGFHPSGWEMVRPASRSN